MGRASFLRGYRSLQRPLDLRRWWAPAPEAVLERLDSHGRGGDRQARGGPLRRPAADLRRLLQARLGHERTWGVLFFHRPRGQRRGRLDRGGLFGGCLGIALEFYRRPDCVSASTRGRSAIGDDDDKFTLAAGAKNGGDDDDDR